MGKLMLVACTNVGRYIIEELVNHPEKGAELVGVINLNPQQALNKANYDSYSDLVAKYGFPIFYCNHINDDETVAFIENGSWAPLATKVMRGMLEGCKNLTYTDAGVKMLSALNKDSENAIDALAKELCK